MNPAYIPSKPISYGKSAVLIWILAGLPQIEAQIPRFSNESGRTAIDPQGGDLLPSRDDLARQREVVREEIEQLEGKVTERIASELAAQQLLELERSERFLGFALREMARSEEIDSNLPRSESLGLAEKLGHSAPFSVFELDRVLDELDAARVSEDLYRKQWRVASSELESARKELEEAKVGLRLHRDEGLGRMAPGGQSELLLSLRVRSSENQVVFRRLEAANITRLLERDAQHASELASLASGLRESVVVTATDREVILNELLARRQELETELEAIGERVVSSEERWAASAEELRRTEDPSQERFAGADVRRLELGLDQLQQEILSRRLERSELLETIWRLRFQALAGELEAAQLAPVLEQLETHLEILDRARRVAEIQADQRRLLHRLTAERQQSTPSKMGLSPTIGEQQDALASTISLYEEEIREIDLAERLARRLEVEMKSSADRLSFDEQVSIVWGRAADLWRYEITTADGRPITVGKIATAVLLILLGYWIAKTVSSRLESSVFPKLGLTPGASAAFQTLVFYLLLVVFVFWALRLVAIPLTVFTVLGGVLAIGIGFGSQNIVNNFISGLIILAERPVKVGDLIDLDGMFGKVERIGPRSSHIRSGDNTHIIVPNSAFLEKNVLNWTMSDDVVRTWIDVGVVYGSSVKPVAELMEKAIEAESSILQSPSPEVLFMDFGDNSLLFRAYFWVQVRRPLDLQRAQSRLRFHIEASFRESAIEIAFPQRDVHLDSRRPIQVQLFDPHEDPQPECSLDQDLEVDQQPPKND